MKKLSLLIALLISASAVFSQVKFEKGSVSEVLAKAKSENKIVMVDVLTDWCKWCIELDNKVYAKSEIYDFANANQINYKIDAEKGEGIKFAKKYNIQGYPTILFLDASGNEIDRIYGYVPMKEFKEMMVDYNKGINTYGDLKSKLEKDPNDIEANIKFADKLMTLSELDNAKKHLSKVIETDPENKAGKTDDAKYKLVSLSDKETIIQNLENFIKENPESDVLKEAYINLSESYFYVKNDEGNSEKWFKETLSKYPNDDIVNSSYGQYLNQRAYALMDKGTTEDDYKKGLSFIDAALPFVSGSVNEASAYYIQSKLYYNLKEYSKALESIDKSLKIFNRKLYRDHKEKIEKQLSSK
ncbi:MAG: thioredoxin fold domain-containing protein [Chlorobi bacterium]|nr:thioredoxin fold domain-containing protein [Chlorobiota bacterium]MCI0716816.1 thioredoxin fold domain-containing protein [Chlorobiota bacterium]